MATIGNSFLEQERLNLHRLLSALDEEFNNRQYTSATLTVIEINRQITEIQEQLIVKEVFRLFDSNS